MKEQVEEFLADLLSMGMSREKVAEKGYDFALAQEMDLHKEGSPVTANAMSRAAQQVKDALPGAYRIYELRTRMR